MAQDLERPCMGQLAFRGEPEALVGLRFGVGLVWVGSGLGEWERPCMGEPALRSEPTLSRRARV